MMQQFLRERFSVERDSDGVELFRFETDGKTCYAPVVWFAETFADAGSPVTAATLKAIDSDDRLGWHRHFDAWVEQGIIPAE